MSKKRRDLFPHHLRYAPEIAKKCCGVTLFDLMLLNRLSLTWEDAEQDRSMQALLGRHLILLGWAKQRERRDGPRMVFWYPPAWAYEFAYKLTEGAWTGEQERAMRMGRAHEALGLSEHQMRKAGNPSNRERDRRNMARSWKDWPGVAPPRRTRKRGRWRK